jgi:hypothetical protein
VFLRPDELPYTQAINRAGCCSRQRMKKGILLRVPRVPQAMKQRRLLRCPPSGGEPPPRRFTQAADLRR